jgi:hypothetical protein
MPTANSSFVAGYVPTENSNLTVTVHTGIAEAG